MQSFQLKSIAVAAFGPSLLYGIADGAIVPVVALSARGLGADVPTAALMITVLGIGSLVTNIPASLITARFGEKWAIVGAALWCAGAMALAATAPNLAVFAAAVFMVGMASAVFYLARQSYLTEAVPYRMRARALSTLGGVMRIGMFIGPFLGAGAMHFVGLHGAYWVGVVALLAAAALGLRLPELEPTGAGQSQPGQPKPSGPPTPRPLRAILADHRRVFLTVGSGVLMVGAVRSARQVVLPLWAENIGLNPTMTAVIYGLSGAVDMLVFYPAGRIMDRHGRAWVAVPSMLIMGLSLLLLPLASDAIGLLVAALLVGFGNGIGSGLIMTLGADYAPPNARAGFLGIWRLFNDAGAMSGPAILSAVTAAATLAVGIAGTGVLALLAAAVLWLSINRGKPDLERAAAGR